ncbi:MAG TPA: cytochrome c family protein [Rhizomicrobium sp.]|nr:cytochrome c family protein [Rhizomicrobium sp.]
MARPMFCACVLGLFASAALAAGDPSRGRMVFAQCQQCHSADRNGGNGLGPNLFGVVGRKAASLPDFYYSPALKNAHITWTEPMLKKWVSGPQKLVPGTRMMFSGLTRPQDIDDVVAFLKTRK